jgi:hypothetical protein
MASRNRLSRCAREHHGGWLLNAGLEQAREHCTNIALVNARPAAAAGLLRGNLNESSFNITSRSGSLESGPDAHVAEELPGEECREISNREGEDGGRVPFVHKLQKWQDLETWCGRRRAP